MDITMDFDPVEYPIPYALAKARAEKQGADQEVDFSHPEAESAEVTDTDEAGPLDFFFDDVNRAQQKAEVNHMVQDAIAPDTGKKPAKRRETHYKAIRKAYNSGFRTGLLWGSLPLLLTELAFVAAFLLLRLGGAI